MTIISNTYGKSLYPFADFRLYSWSRSQNKNSYSLDFFNENYNSNNFLLYNHYFFYPFNKYRFNQVLFWKEKYCPYRKEECITKVRKKLMAQIKFINKSICKDSSSDKKFIKSASIYNVHRSVFLKPDKIKPFVIASLDSFKCL